MKLLLHHLSSTGNLLLRQLSSSSVLFHNRHLPLRSEAPPPSLLPPELSPPLSFLCSTAQIQKPPRIPLLHNHDGAASRQILHQTRAAVLFSTPPLIHNHESLLLRSASSVSIASVSIASAPSHLLLFSMLCSSSLLRPPPEALPEITSILSPPLQVVSRLSFPNHFSAPDRRDSVLLLSEARRNSQFSTDHPQESTSRDSSPRPTTAPVFSAPPPERAAVALCSANVAGNRKSTPEFFGQTARPTSLTR